MKGQKENKKVKLIYSSLHFKNKNFKFLSEKQKIKEKANIKLLNKISNNRLDKEENKERIIFIKGESVFNDLIILLLISIIFKLTYQNSIEYKDSIITLKVSHNGEQKIFYGGTNPNEVWIDDNKQQSVTIVII